jgi:hypothetical protein
VDSYRPTPYGPRVAQNLIAGAIGALLVAALCWASIRVSGVGFVTPHGWRELDPARRRAIGKAVSAGAAVEGTQAEAWLAAELASGSLARWSLGRRVGVPLAFGAFAVLLLAVALARGDVWTAIVALVLGLLQVTALVVNRRRRSRLQAAFAANLERAANG